jgi:pimeloyl-ACP methyl ester carboxylesterase
MNLRTPLILFLSFVLSISCHQSSNQTTQSSLVSAESSGPLKTTDVRFESEGVTLAGTIFEPENSYAALVIVHGSDRVPRMTEFATLLAKSGITVLTYDKRGVGESGGVYAGPEVGTNNISFDNLNLLAKDASAAVNKLRKHDKNLSIGLIGFSQAGWIIPITAHSNSLVQYMVLFSCPTITTLEQLRFQFYTNGNTSFWENHSLADAREHTENDPDKYQFKGTDPKTTLSTLSIPGLWLYGEKDIQIPVKIDIEHLNTFKAKGKPFEYCLFPSLGHNTAFSNSTEPVDIAVQWVKSKAEKLNKNS